MRSILTSPDTDLVLLGGGHSHVAVLKSFGMNPMPNVRLTLVTRDVHTPYSGMLPGYIAGHYDYDDCHIDLRPLARFAQARLIHAETDGLDLDHNTVCFAERPPLRFDYLSINTGSHPPAMDVPGANEYAVPVKPIDRFLNGWQDILQRVCESHGPYHLAVAGAGAGGVELLLACQYHLGRLLRARGDTPERLHWTLVSASPDILPGHNEKVRRIFERVLAERGVDVFTGTAVSAVRPDSMVLSDGQTLPANSLFWVTGAAAAHWLRESALKTTESGFIRVNASFQSLSHPQVFAVGDNADVVDYPRPKSGVFAVRQGPPLAANLRRILNSQPPKPYKPQQQFLSLISTGDRYAVASRGAWAAEGRWLWRWKDHIDRAFMTRYGKLPEMSASTQDHTGPMHCAGCGAKIGSEVLTRALSKLKTSTDSANTDIVLALGAPDDAAVLKPPPGKLLVQSTDHFRALVDDPYVFGQLAAEHALNDLFAMGAKPHSVLAHATLPHAAAELQEETLYQLLAGTLTVLEPLKAKLIGGHSSEGAELAFGLTVNGWAEPGQLLRKSGLQAGDHLILTKPLGTGILFAADMRRQAKGRWIDAAIASMLQSSAAASRILQAHRAQACTDISGFGLLGHLLEMLRPAGLSAQLDLAALPVLEGVLELAEQGIESSLASANRVQKDTIANHSAVADLSIYAVLFDPQTAGGLLAGVPAEYSETCLAELKNQAYRAALIGEIKNGPLRIELR